VTAQEVTYLPMSPTLWGGLIVLIALYLIPAVGALRERQLGWLLLVLLMPPFGGLAWWGVQIATMRRLRQHT
jgi:hypothetical protein